MAISHLTKPVVVVAHGDTWNLGHELYLAGDVRVAAANTNFGQDENTHGRFPGGGATEVVGCCFSIRSKIPFASA